MTEDEKREKELADAKKKQEAFNQFKNSVLAHALASSTEELLGEILVELKIMNSHLESISKATFMTSLHARGIEMNTSTYM